MNFIKPIARLNIRNRRTAAKICGIAILLLIVAVLLPAPIIQSSGHTKLDYFMPTFQYFESHSIRIHAPPDPVYRSIREATANEIRFFQTLTWIRSPRWPGTTHSEGILNAPGRKPILEVARNSGFLLLAEDVNRELVMGTIPCCKKALLIENPQDFLEFNQPGYAKATMNFLLEPDEPGVDAAHHGDARVRDGSCCPPDFHDLLADHLSR